MFICKVLVILFISLKICQSAKTKVAYMEMIHINVDYVDANFISINATVFSKRYDRRNPIYFLTLYINTLRIIDSSYTLHFYAYELLSNVYKPSLVDFRMSYCNFLKEDSILARPLKAAITSTPLKCPLPKGVYLFERMPPPYGMFLKGFPFKQGRFYLNISDSKKVLGSAHADIEIKEMAAEKFFKYIKT